MQPSGGAPLAPSLRRAGLSSSCCSLQGWAGAGEHGAGGCQSNGNCECLLDVLMKRCRSESRFPHSTERALELQGQPEQPHFSAPTCKSPDSTLAQHLAAHSKTSSLESLESQAEGGGGAGGSGSTLRAPTDSSTEASAEATLREAASSAGSMASTAPCLVSADSEPCHAAAPEVVHAACPAGQRSISHGSASMGSEGSGQLREQLEQQQQQHGQSDNEPLGLAAASVPQALSAQPSTRHAAGAASDPASVGSRHEPREAGGPAPAPAAAAAATAAPPPPRRATTSHADLPWPSSPSGGLTTVSSDATPSVGAAPGNPDGGDGVGPVTRHKRSNTLPRLDLTLERGSGHAQQQHIRRPLGTDTGPGFAPPLQSLPQRQPQQQQQPQQPQQPQQQQLLLNSGSSTGLISAGSTASSSSGSSLHMSMRQHLTLRPSPSAAHGHAHGHAHAPPSPSPSAHHTHHQNPMAVAVGGPTPVAGASPPQAAPPMPVPASGPLPGHAGRGHHHPHHHHYHHHGSSSVSSSSTASASAAVAFRVRTTSAPSSHPLALDPLTAIASSSSDECEEATRRITAAFPHLLPGGGGGGHHHHLPHHGRAESWSVFGGRGPEPATPRLMRSEQASADGSPPLTPEEAEALERRRAGRTNYHLTQGAAAVELFLRLNHARQTLDFVKRQSALFSSLDRAEMGVWQALDMLNELREYEAAMLAGSQQVDPDMSLKEHALQTAELCRLAHPDKDWLHLVGLMHGLGKLLAHRTFGSQPPWATCGESFPLGCRFDPSLRGMQFFSANPDRRRRLYNTPLGIYHAGCGLSNVYMSWSAAEYLYLMLLLNDTELPEEALFIVRYQKFYSLVTPTSSYRHLLSKDDEALLPLLASFQSLSAYRRVALPAATALSPEAQTAYYDGLISKYIGAGKKLAW